jgi:hypothetical protein
VRGRIAAVVVLLLLAAVPGAGAQDRAWVQRALGLQYELASDVDMRNAPWVYTHNSYNSDAEMGTTLSNRDPNQSMRILDQLDVAQQGHDRSDPPSHPADNLGARAERRARPRRYPAGPVTS